MCSGELGPYESLYHCEYTSTYISMKESKYFACVYACVCVFVGVHLIGIIA